MTPIWWSSLSPRWRPTPIAVSHQGILGPYNLGSIDNYTRKSGYAEDGFDPHSDLDIRSLRFGSDSAVNYGEGCQAVRAAKAEEDLIVYFQGKNGLNRFDFDFKLLGQTKGGDLVIGYALLPGNSPTAASLVALPVQVREENGAKALEGVVENNGLTDSRPVEAVVMEHSNSGWKTLKRFPIPAVKPYENKTVLMKLDRPDTENCEYEIRIVGQKTCEGFWQKVDDTDKSVEFAGSCGPYAPIPIRRPT